MQPERGIRKRMREMVAVAATWPRHGGRTRPTQ